MNKAFLFAETDVQIVPGGWKQGNLKMVVKNAIDRAVIVQTPEMIGSAVVIGGKVITSLYLVQNCREVKVRFSGGKRMPAFVGRRDHELNIAEIVPTARPENLSPNPKLGSFGGIGDALLVVNTATGTPSARVAGMMYVTQVSERWGDSWRINPHSPKGLMGSGVWNLAGKFMGLAIGERLIPKDLPTPKVVDVVDEEEVKRIPGVYTLPFDQVMEFVETSG